MLYFLCRAQAGTVNALAVVSLILDMARTSSNPESFAFSSLTVESPLYLLSVRSLLMTSSSESLFCNCWILFWCKFSNSFFCCSCCCWYWVCACEKQRNEAVIQWLWLFPSKNLVCSFQPLHLESSFLLTCQLLWVFVAQCCSVRCPFIFQFVKFPALLWQALY